MANGNNSNADDDAAAAATTSAQTQQEQQNENLTGIGACSGARRTSSETVRGSINDLVADLWLNGNSRESGYGDYTNIRATTTTAAIGTAAPAVVASTTQSSGGGGSSSFSFKHFLNSSGTITAPSTTVTSLDAVATTLPLSTTTSTNPLQTSTGTRPKVPQSASASLMQPDINGSSAASKMKRSPRFSSFDSQASLAEYAACGTGGSRLRPDLRLEHKTTDDAMLDNDDDDDRMGLAQVRNSRLYDERVDDDIFPSAASNMHAGAASSRYVPRSYSSYDMPPHAVATSQRRRACAGATGNRDLRPNRLVLNTTPKMKLDLPLDTSNVAGTLAGVGLPAPAAALPDFVQDHLPDAWCGGGGHDAHLSSPPNSPMGDDEPPVGAVGGGLLPAAMAGLPCAAVCADAVAASTNNSSAVKMLPDFLSDGPIIHSSQRLADVAIGLPSNSIDSPPQDAISTLQLCTLRQENERLQLELQEMRVELNAQTQRALDFEQQLRRNEALALATSTQTTQRLRRQVALLEAEIIDLRRTRELSGDGAVGGNCERVATAATTTSAPAVTPGSSGSAGTSSNSSATRPSRTHQLSRDLLCAADNAEQNLRQLLVGVDNLRQMAANLEQPATSTATPRSPDLYTDFN